MKVAIVVHLYYIEMLDDLCGHLDELRRHMEFDVFVTTRVGADTKLIADRLMAKEVVVVENRGKDVLPFLNTLPKLKGYDYALKIHSKTLSRDESELGGPRPLLSVQHHIMGDSYYNRIPQNKRLTYLHWSIGAEMGNEQCCKNIRWATESGFGCELEKDKVKLDMLPKPPSPILWRDLIWNELMRPEKAHEALKCLSQGDTALYAPDLLWVMSPAMVLTNEIEENMRKIRDAIGGEIPSDSKPFVAGNMFWFRPDSLMWLTDYDLDTLFTKEDGSTDGKMEHAFERCFHQFSEAVS